MIIDKIKGIVSDLLLIEVITEIFAEVNTNIIDNTRSEVVQKNNLILIKLVSKNDKCCPVIIIFGINNKYGLVRVFYNVSPPIIEEFYKTKEDLFEIKNSIFSYLKTPVKEILFYVVWCKLPRKLAS